MKKSVTLEESLSVSEKIENFIKEDKNCYKDIKNIISNQKIQYIVTLARGTSDCAATFSSYLFAKSLGLPTYSLPPSIITLENSKFDFSQALVIVITQSGLSEDLLECESRCRSMGAKTLVISNNLNSPILKKANYFFNINAGKEMGIAATKTFILTLLCIIKLISTIIENKKLIYKINDLPKILFKEQENLWDENILNKDILSGFILSRGIGYALSTEISLKFKELCQEQIEPFSSAEVMHGPKSLIGENFKIFTISMIGKSGLHIDKSLKVIKEKANFVYSIGPNDASKYSMTYNSTDFTELDSLIIMSKFYPLIIKYSIIKGLDPDKPRYLKKLVSTY